MPGPMMSDGIVPRYLAPPRGHLARDGAGKVALTAILLALAPRVWTVAMAPSELAYALFPWGAQAAVLAVYAGQLGVETWGGHRLRLVAAVCSAVVAAGSAGLFLAADWRSAQWAYWAAQAGIEAWVAYRLAIDLGKRG